MEELKSVGSGGGSDTLEYVIKGVGVISIKPTVKEKETTYDATFMRFPGSLNDAT
jgi:hypothetical protein